LRQADLPAGGVVGAIGPVRVEAAELVGIAIEVERGADRAAVRPAIHLHRVDGSAIDRARRHELDTGRTLGGELDQSLRDGGRTNRYRGSGSVAVWRLDQPGSFREGMTIALWVPS
jgi:hypothetical protein